MTESLYVPNPYTNPGKPQTDYSGSKDQQVIIVDIQRHFPAIHGDVAARIANAFVFREV